MRRPARWPAALTIVVVLLPAAGRAAPAPPSAPSAERVHEVKRGDTLGAIARRYGVSVAALVAVNRLARANVILKIGQRLVIPAPAAPARRTTVAARRRPELRMPPNMVLAVPDFTQLPPIFTWPIDGPVSSPFGRRRSGWHRGIDIKAELGLPIAVAAPGVVVASGWEPRYGRVIKVEHPNAFTTIYAHNSENQVAVGDRVFAGDTIALIGRSGRATANHLHFEIRHAGLAYNPLYLLPFPPRVSGVDETEPDETDDTDE